MIFEEFLENSNDYSIKMNREELLKNKPDDISDDDIWLRAIENNLSLNDESTLKDVIKYYKYIMKNKIHTMSYYKLKNVKK